MSLLTASSRTGIVLCPNGHRPVPERALSCARTGIVQCPDGHRPICEEIFESSRRLSDIVRCPAGHRTVPGRAPLESYDINFERKYAMVTNHLRAPYGVYLTKIVRFYGARTAPGRRQKELYDFLSFCRHRTVPGEF